MKKLILIIGLFISLSVFSSDWKCLSVELNDTTLTYQCDSMILRGGIVFCENDTLIMWTGCVPWKQIDDEVCFDCYDCNGKTLRVKLNESYDAWMNRQKVRITGWSSCN